MSNTRRCLGCEAIELERKNIPEDAKGVKVFLEPREVAEAREAEEEAAAAATEHGEEDQFGGL